MPRGRKMGQGSLKCPKCDRTFAMPAHLGRHMATIHGAGGAKRKKKRRGRVGRPPGSARIGRPPGRGRVGRPPGRTAVAGALSGLSLEELSHLITAARSEARRKISAFHQSMK